MAALRSGMGGGGPIHLVIQPTMEQTQKKQLANSELGIGGKGSGDWASLSPLVCTSKRFLLFSRKLSNPNSLSPDLYCLLPDLDRHTLSPTFAFQGQAKFTSL